MAAGPEVFRAAVAAAALRLTSSRSGSSSSDCCDDRKRRKEGSASTKGKGDSTTPISATSFFESILPGPSHYMLLKTGKVSRASERSDLNRYSDCYPLDSHLTATPSGQYLNASTVNLRTDVAASRVIVAAGPMAPEWYGPDTRPAFWEAVWHNRVRVVLALATPQPGCQGCASYAETGKFGNVTVNVLAEVPADGLRAVERTLSLTWGSESRTITQIEFVAWPNYGVPGAAASVACLTSRVCELLDNAALEVGPAAAEEVEHTVDPAEAVPLLVHCAGGVGRSGTFATLLSLWQDREVVTLSRSDDVLTAVRDRVTAFRQQRHPYGVETPQQLVLIVTALDELCRADARAGEAADEADAD